MSDEKKKEKPDISGGLRVIWRIIKDMRPIYLWLFFAVILNTFSIILSILSPELLGSLTDIIYSRVHDGIPIVKNEFFILGLKLTATYILACVFGLLTTYVMNFSVTKHFTCKIRVDMSEKIARIPVKSVDNTPNGEFISRMTNDVSFMGGSVHDIFGVIINGVIRLVLITVIIVRSNAVMAIAVIVFVPISLILSAFLSSKSEKHFNESRKYSGKIYSICEENITGFDTVKVFGIEDSQQKRYEAILCDFVKHGKKGYVVSGMVQPIVVLINNLAYIAICCIGAFLAINGKISAGTLVAFIMYTKLFSAPLESIAGGMSMMQSTIASARRVYEFLDSEEMTENNGLLPAREIKGDVVFENVYFSYSSEKPLIENFNLTVKAGQKVAIVGPTGSGKTTIVNLLMRFYDAQSGRILVDGIDITTIKRDEVRKCFGMVLQDTVLFSGSIYDNIAYGNEGADREDVINAAKYAHIDELIGSLQDGYDTFINEDSTNISGGQKQLLTIARAYLSNRPILILDEATSNVDTRTELLIQNTMDDLMKGKTSFVIAHRLSTVENADIILVIDKGRIAETGTHSELLEAGGLYAKIYNSQYSI